MTWRGEGCFFEACVSTKIFGWVGVVVGCVRTSSLMYDDYIKILMTKVGILMHFALFFKAYFITLYIIYIYTCNVCLNQTRKFFFTLFDDFHFGHFFFFFILKLSNFICFLKRVF